MFLAARTVYMVRSTKPLLESVELSRRRPLRACVLDSYRARDGEPNAIRCAELFAGGWDAAQNQLREAISRLAPGHTHEGQLAQELLDDIAGWPMLLSASEAVAAVLAATGVEIVFAYAGTSELALCDAVDQTAGIRLVNGRGDRESAFMAGGASMLSPNRGAAILHAARGLTNAAGALADIRRSEIGVVLLVGLPTTTSTAFQPPHGEPDLLRSLGAFAGFAWEAVAFPEAEADRAALAAVFVARLHDALESAARPPYHPSLFGIPQDLAEQRWIPPSALLAGSAGSIEPPPFDADPDLVDLAVAALRSAKRPFVIIDDLLLRYRGAREMLAELSGVVGAAVAQVRYRRGPMLFERLQEHEVENFIGWLNPNSSVHAETLSAADLLVTIEDRNMYRRVVGELPACRKIAINSDPAKVLKNDYLRSDDLLLAGEPVAVMADLVARLKAVPTQRRPWFADAARVVGAVTPDPAAPRVQYGRRAVARVLGQALSRWSRPVLVDDSQMFGGMLSEFYEEFPPGLRIFGSHGGFVGCGMSYAVGLALGEPGVRVMCTLGDQAFTNAYQVLVAATQERARVLFVLCNNGESVSLQKQARSSLGERPRDYLSNVAGMSYTRIARAHGSVARRLHVPLGAEPDAIDTAASALSGALADLAAVEGPTLLELVLPSDVDAWRGIWLTDGYDERPADQPNHVGYADVVR
jgi:acetolactate synthase I/II/III large subunit